tara:strand:- start:85 stop:345 length:261 start_codon:yes stop_codon:yes gene_type:complete
MILYFVYFLVVLILIFVSVLAIKAVNRGIKAKNQNLLEDSDVFLEKNIKTENKDLIDKLKNLNDLYKSGSITEEEFKKVKKKIIES